MTFYFRETHMAKDLPKYTVPSMTIEDGAEVAATLQQRLNALNDLALTLKHIHWNVVGPHFIAVHEMLDPQVEAARAMADEVAERIATLGSSPVGTPAALVKDRTWDDYSIGRADAIAHLGALDLVYQGVITDHREAAEAFDETDPVSNDILVGQLRQLELFHWFVRAHLESSSGALSTNGADKETTAASKADASAN
jgi:starvation-inducible DNA-binding protein